MKCVAFRVSLQAQAKKKKKIVSFMVYEKNNLMYILKMLHYFKLVMIDIYIPDLY